MTNQDNKQMPVARPTMKRCVAQALAISVLLPGAATFAFQAPATPATAERKVKLDFVAADIAVVIKAISIQSGENVVLMPSVKGTVTVRLTDVTLPEALRRVAASVGADVLKLDGTYFLGSTTELRAMVAKTGVRERVTLKFVQAADIKELLERAYPFLTVEAGGKTTNTIVLVGTATDIAAAQKIIRELDITPPAPPKVEPPKPIIIRDAYSVKFLDASVLTDTLLKAMPELRITRTDKSMIIEGPTDTVTQAAKLLAALDVQTAGERVVKAYKLKYLDPVQATSTLKPFFPNLTVQAGFESYTPVPASFAPLSIDAAKAFNATGGGAGGAGGGAGGGASGGGGAGGAGGGAAGGIQPGMRSRTIILAGLRDEVEQATQVIATQDVAPQQVLIEARMVDISPSDLKQLGVQFDFNQIQFTELSHGSGRPQQNFFGAFGRTPFGFNTTLEARQTSTDSKILARPNISVIDGNDASMFIGDIIRYERVSSVTESGQQLLTVESIPVGVALLVRPRINADGKMTLRIHPVVSTVSGFTGQRGDLPITSSREADSTVLMQDGETIAISGLLRDEDIKTLTKVPIVGDLPILGQLFRHRNISKKKSEVTIFITAKIQKPV